MYLTTQALVLRITAYNETDAILTLLSGEHGKLSVKARGLRRKNSPLIAPCQLLAYGEFTLFEYRGMYTVNEARSIELFSALRKDLTALSLGTYFVQVAEVISQEDAPNPELLSLLLNSLYALSCLKLPQVQVKAVFELRSACLAGYTPDLSGCKHCAGNNPDRFDVSEGCLECNRCKAANSAGIRLPITQSMRYAMQYICQCGPKRLFQFRAGEETFLALSQLTECYLVTKLERGFSTLDFYKSLF